MDNQFDFSHFEHRFNDIVPSNALNNILEEGKQRANMASIKGSKCVTC